MLYVRMKIFEVIYNEDEDKGIYALSVVEDPAMEQHFIALKKNEPVKLAEVSTEQRILMGLALEPDKPIYRNQGGDEFNIVFPKQTIKAAAHGFLKNGYQNNSTIEHETKLSGVSVVESWIIEDPDNDKSRAYGFEYPQGSWMVCMKVDNDELWNDYVKNGRVKGFSIDGLFSLKQLKLSEVEDKKKSTLEELKDWISTNFGKSKKEEVKLGKMRLADSDTMIAWEGDMLRDGAAVFVITEDDERVPAPDGEHELESGMVITVTDGVITAINEKQTETETEMNNETIEEIKKMLATMSTEISEEIEKRVSGIKEEFENTLTQLKSDHSEEINKLNEKFDAQPAAEPIKKGVQLSTDEGLNRDGRMLNVFRNQKTG